MDIKKKNILEIIVFQPDNNTLTSQLVEIVTILESLKNNNQATEIIFDLSNLKFILPFQIIVLSALINKLRKKLNVNVIKGNNSDINNYLDTICFHEGLKPDNISNWSDKYINKNYIPILNFSTSRTPENSIIVDNVISRLNDILKKTLRLNTNCYNAVTYLISELTDNIIEHSGEDRGLLLTQFYERKECIDICLIDCGKTILGSYKEHGGYPEINTDIIALEKAIEGISTKNIERGRGIPTSREMILKGLKGNFILYSGNAIILDNKIFNIKYRWDGTVVALRVPKNIEKFNFYNYVY